MLWIPLVWLMSRLHTGLAVAFPILVYWGAWRFGWELSADPVTGRSWYFNPFAWQLMFFTGFSLGAGWLPMPRPNRKLTGLCLLLVAAAIPLGHQPTYSQIAFLGKLRQDLEPLLDKSHLGILRWVHFLALAYLMNRLFQWKPHWFGMALPRRIAQMGQQALPTFLLCMGLSYLGGMALDWVGRDTGNVAWVNLTGLGLMLLGAQVLAWLDSKPWRATGGYLAGTPGIRGVFSKSVLILPLLVFLSASPWLLLHNNSQAGADTSAQRERLPEAERNTETSDVSLQSPPEEQREWLRWLLIRCMSEADRACDWLDSAMAPPPQEKNDLESF